MEKRNTFQRDIVDTFNDEAERSTREQVYLKTQGGHLMLRSQKEEEPAAKGRKRVSAIEEEIKPKHMVFWKPNKSSVSKI